MTKATRQITPATLERLSRTYSNYIRADWTLKVAHEEAKLLLTWLHDMHRSVENGALWCSIVMRYGRCFVGGRTNLGSNVLIHLTSEEARAHGETMHLRHTLFGHTGSGFHSTEAYQFVNSGGGRRDIHVHVYNVHTPEQMDLERLICLIERVRDLMKEKRDAIYDRIVGALNA